MKSVRSEARGVGRGETAAITRAAHALACTENMPCDTPSGGVSHD